MKIAERSPERLRLTHLGWYYAAGAGVFGMLCLWAALNLYASGNMRDAAIFFFLGCGASVGLALVATRRVSVTLDRARNLAEVRNATAFGKQLRTAPLDQVDQATMQTSFTGDLPLHRLVLQFHDREAWVVTKMYTSGDGTSHAIEQINAWLGNPDLTSDPDAP